MAVKNEQIAEALDAQGNVIPDAKLGVTDAAGNLVPDAKVINKVECTVTCDLCSKEVKFDQANKNIHLEVPWLQNARRVLTADGRELIYCCDECNVHACTSGVLNMPNKKLIDIAEGGDAIKKAAMQAEMQKRSDEAIKNVRLD